MSTAYSEAFFDSQESGSLTSAKAMVPYIYEVFMPRSVVDVGCGLGTWLSVFRQYGVIDLMGLDGLWVNLDRFKIEPERFRQIDLSNPGIPDRRFDLVLSLEVAEHIEAAAAERLIDFLTALGDIVVFSAAIPLQGGVHHVNEQWPDYWFAKFQARGYQVLDLFRPRFWNESAVDFWYTQNMFAYIRKPVAPTLVDRAMQERIRQEERQPPIWVHPRMFLEANNRVPGLRSIMKALPGAIVGAARRRLRLS